MVNENTLGLDKLPTQLTVRDRRRHDPLYENMVNRLGALHYMNLFYEPAFCSETK